MEKQFLNAFRQARVAVYRPAMENFGEYIKAKGYDYSIEEIDEHVGSEGRTLGPFIRLTLYLVPGERLYYGYHPGLIINGDKRRRKVFLGQSTMSPGRDGDVGPVGVEWDPDALSADQIQEHLVDFAEKLFV